MSQPCRYREIFWQNQTLYGWKMAVSSCKSPTPLQFAQAWFYSPYCCLTEAALTSKVFPRHKSPVKRKFLPYLPKFPLPVSSEMLTLFWILKWIVCNRIPTGMLQFRPFRKCRGILDWTLDSGSAGCGFRFLSMPGTCVLQQDTLSTLLLSTQVYKWVPGRMQTLFVAWCGMCAPLKCAPGQNAPHRVEKVHYECRIDIESSNRG